MTLESDDVWGSSACGAIQRMTTLEYVLPYRNRPWRQRFVLWMLGDTWHEQRREIIGLQCAAMLLVQRDNDLKKLIDAAALRAIQAGEK